MDKKLKVKIAFIQKVYHKQEVEITTEQFNTLKENIGSAMNEKTKNKSYSIIQNNIVFKENNNGGYYDIKQVELVD